MSEIAQTEFNDKTNIKVVGVGGAGGNAVNRMIAEGLQNVEFVAVNTDAKDLMRSDADVKISLSDKSSRGLGAGADPERGAKAAQDHQSDIEESLKGADMVFVTCGEGGGTGTGASPIVARAAHQQGALTIAVVTRPFGFEGPQRAASADYGIDNLRKEVDALIVIPNDRLLELSDRSIGIIEAFKTADTALLAGVQGITDLISMNSYIHVDFSDVNSILRGAGTALFGIGSARGEDRATQAAEIAISSPLLEESIEGAHGALINIAGPTDLKLQEASAATELVRKAIHPEAQISGVSLWMTPMATKCVSRLSPLASILFPHRRRLIVRPCPRSFLPTSPSLRRQLILPTIRLVKRLPRFRRMRPFPAIRLRCRSMTRLPNIRPSPSMIRPVTSISPTSCAERTDPWLGS